MTPSADQLAELAKTALEDMKAENITVLPIGDISSIADYMLIASGTSTRHVKSIATNVENTLKEAGIKPLGTEGEGTSEWILVDLGSVIVHIMLPSTREFMTLKSYGPCDRIKPLKAKNKGHL